MFTKLDQKSYGQVRKAKDGSVIAAVDRAIARMDKWRAANPKLCKVPDAAGERLIGGGTCMEK